MKGDSLSAMKSSESLRQISSTEEDAVGGSSVGERIGRELGMISLVVDGDISTDLELLLSAFFAVLSPWEFFVVLS